MADRWQVLLLRLGLGLIVSTGIGFLAYRRNSLSQSGVLGAIIVGTVIFGFGGWIWGVLLIVFFILSSLLSHYKENLKEEMADKFAKGSRRDLGQTLANGGIGALIAFVSQFYPDSILLAAFAGAMATVNADTWATELGVLSKRSPRLITTWRAVAPGTSGGVSALGTLAAGVGALTIGLAGLGLVVLDGLLGGTWLERAESGSLLGGLWLILAAAIGGLAGSMFDSLLGATVQAIYYSPSRQKETEKRRERDGKLNVHVRGWRWMENDHVNLISSIVGALVSASIWAIVAR